MYRYTTCGLENIVLKNGYTIKETPYGTGVSIDDIDGLHRAIAADIIRKPSRMTGEEFRFLRKEQDLTQAEMAAILGVSEQTVLAWERNRHGAVHAMPDMCMRAYYIAHIQVSVPLANIFTTKDQEVLSEHAFEHRADGWLAMAA